MLPDTIGVDLGGTKVAAAIVDPEGRVLAERRVATNPAEGPEAVLAGVVALVRGLARERAAGAVGVGIAGQVDARTGAVRLGPNLGGHALPLRARLEEVLALPVAVTNDVRAAVVGEWRHGAGRGEQDLVGLFLGTGVGGGVVSGGRLLAGAGNAAGELGHMTIVAGGRPCTCRNRGCLEAYVGGWALAERAREAAKAQPRDAEALVARAGSPEALTAEHVARAFAAGDPLARRLVEETEAFLEAGLVSIVHAFNPRVLVLGGGVVEGLPHLVEAAERGLRRRAFPASLEGLRVVRAALGPRAGVVGAAAFARDALAGRED